MMHDFTDYAIKPEPSNRRKSVDSNHMLTL